MRSSRALFGLALFFLTLSARAEEDVASAGATEARSNPPPASSSLSDPESDDAEEGLTVTVQGRMPPPRPVSTAVVTARDFAALPRRTAEDALKLVPGVTMVQHGAEGKAQQFFLRGFDAMHGSDIELNVAGIPINEWSNVHSQGYLDIGFVVPETVASVTVTKGPFSIEQGPFATAGSVNYELGVPEEKLGVWARYTVGSTNRQRGVVTYSPKDGDGHDFLALEAVHDDGFGQNRKVNRASLLGQAALLKTPRHGKISVLGSAYLAEFQLPGALKNKDVELGRIGFYDTYDPAGRGSSGRLLLGIRHTLETSSASVETTAFTGYRHLSLLENYTGYLIDEANGDRRQQLQDTFSFGLLSKTVVPLTETSDFEAGLGVRGDALTQSQEHLGLGEEVLATDRDLSGVQVNTHVALGVRLRPSERFGARLGLRFDSAHLRADERRPSLGSGEGTLALVSPRAILTYRPLAALSFSASGGQGFRPPELRAFTSYKPPVTGLPSDLYSGGEPNMTPAYSVDLGCRYQPTRAFGMSGSGFVTWIDRESIYDHVSGVNLELNATRRIGGELEVHVRPWTFLTLRADVTAVDARFSGSGQPIPFVPTTAGGVRAILNHPSGLRAGARFFGLLPRPLPHGAVGAPLALFDLSLGWTYRNVSLDLDLENVFDLRVREGEYHYASRFYPDTDDSALPELHFVAGPPRNLRVTVSAVF